MADTDIKTLESYQYPNTHVGHLSAEHQAKLKEFEQLCEKKGYYTPKGKNGIPSHDDETMLRYLRARKFVPSEAFQQFKDTEDWRKANKLDQLYDTIDVEEYDQSRRLYPQWTGRMDRRGIPLYLFEVAHLNAKAVAAYETSTSSKHQVNLTSKVPPKMLRLFALYENLVNFALPLCSALPDRPYPETPVSQSNNIVDISGVGLRQFWNLKNHMQDASQLATAHYPETLDRIFIIGAPSFFPTVWGWIKRWFDPITVSKIFILSKETMKATLEEYIDPENIPSQYGGKLKYKFGELPNLDPKLEKILEWSAPEKLNGANTFPTGPIRLQKYEDGDLAIIAVGSENGQARNKKIATLTPDSTVAQTSLGAGNQSHQLLRTATGVSTHPPEPTAEDMAAVEPLSDQTTPTGSVAEPSGAEPTVTAPSALEPSGAGFGTVAGAGAAGGTYLVYREAKPVEHLQDTQSQSVDTAEDKPRLVHPSTDREGTSTSRYVDQSHTHAHGNVAEGTPHVAGTQGDRYSVMEPNTVGQAPKEHPMSPVEEPPAPSYLEQAKAMAGSAAAAGTSALAAVGLVSPQKVEEEKEEKKVVHDPEVDTLEQHKVEEFLRAKYPSTHHSKEGTMVVD